MSLYLLVEFVANRFQWNSVETDNAAFKLHYRATNVILVIFSMVFYTAWAWGDIVNCLMDAKDLDSGLVNEYCKIEGIYTAFPTCGQEGKGPQSYIHQTIDGDPRKYHRIYQWLGMIFFLQSLLFYIPRYVWKQLEDGHMKLLTNEMSGPFVIKEGKSGQIKMMADYLVGNRGNYGNYFAGYVFCEILNLLNLLFQISLYCAFFGFYDLGPLVIKFFSRWDLDAFDRHSRVPKEVISALGYTMVAQNVRAERGRAPVENYCYENVSPLELNFPTTSKCEFSYYGPTGQIQNNDGMCVLWFNSVNQIIFTFLWFWFVFLGIVTILAVCYRLLTAFSTRVRIALLRSKYPTCNDADLADFVRDSSVGDWFILYQISKNISTEIAQDVMQNVLEQLEKPRAITAREKN